MNNYNKTLVSILLTMMIVVTIGCQKKEVESVEDVVETAQLHDIASTSVVGGGTYTGQAIECGICWSVNPNPAISDDHVVSETTTGDFFCLITGLEPLTTYHVRAYAISSSGIDYGLDRSFTTLPLHTDGYVDLGLPSGTLWATCNVGATTPEDYGGYYRRKINQYTPAIEDWVELINNCTMAWIERNGINGQLITASNGSSIFLPAAGYRSNDSIVDDGIGHYWSSSHGEWGPYIPEPGTTYDQQNLYYCFDSIDYDMHFCSSINELCIRTILPAAAR